MAAYYMAAYYKEARAARPNGIPNQGTLIVYGNVVDCHDSSCQRPSRFT